MESFVDRLSTITNLFRIGVQLKRYLCLLCKRVDETIQHFFINYTVVKEVWDACERWLGYCLLDMSLFCLIIIIFNYGCYTKYNQLWKILWVAIMTKTQAHRNKVIFRNGVVDSVEIFSLVQIRGWHWLKHKVKRAQFTYSDWILCLFTLFEIFIFKRL